MTESGRSSPGSAPHGGGHGWLMIICCIPMLALAVALVASGTASPGFLFFAVMCTAMMALMMRGMDDVGGDDDHGSSSDPRRRHGHP